VEQEDTQETPVEHARRIGCVHAYYLRGLASVEDVASCLSPARLVPTIIHENSTRISLQLLLRAPTLPSKGFGPRT
jgi:hypothetical protein